MSENISLLLRPLRK